MLFSVEIYDWVAKRRVGFDSFFYFILEFRIAKISVISYPNSIKVFDFERLNLGAQP